MERKLSFIIEKQYENIAISEFLKLQGFSSQNIIEIKKMHRSVLIGEEWVHMNYRLKNGEILLIHIQENETNKKIIPRPLPFPIIYEDEDLVVINKPSDMPVHPSQNNYENTLANAAAYYFEELKNTAFTFRCINRLDRNTTGLTILAKNMYAASVLANQMQNRKIKRLYLALVDGSLPQKWGTIRLPIGRKNGSTIERQIDLIHGETAITHYYLINKIRNYSLVALQLETGRTHQIRVHMSSIGAPIVGDTLYNNKPSATILPRQALHAHRIRFLHPVTKQLMHFTAPIPDDMNRLFL